MVVVDTEKDLASDGSSRSQIELDYHANQSNPNNIDYQSANDNHADQLNLNNPN